MTTSDMLDLIHEMEEIQEETRVLIGRASRVMRQLPDTLAARVKGYWYANLVLAVGNNHDFLARCQHTMDDTLNEMRDLFKHEMYHEAYGRKMDAEQAAGWPCPICENAMAAAGPDEDPVIPFHDCPLDG